MHELYICKFFLQAHALTHTKDVALSTAVHTMRNPLSSKYIAFDNFLYGENIVSCGTGKRFVAIQETITKKKKLSLLFQCFEKIDHPKTM